MEVSLDDNHGKSEHSTVYHTQTRVDQMQSLGGRYTWRPGKPGSPLPCEAPLHSHPGPPRLDL